MAIVELKCVICQSKIPIGNGKGRPRKKYCSLKCTEKGRIPSEHRIKSAKAYAKAHYQANKDTYKVKGKAWKAANPTKFAIYAKKYRENNADIVKERQATYLEVNREDILARRRELRKRPEKIEAAKAYAATYKDKSNVTAKLWQRKKRLSDPEAHRAKQNEYYKNNPITYLAKSHRRWTRLTGAGGSYTITEWKSLLAIVGNFCLSCGNTAIKLTVDHIVPVSKGGTSNISNLQPLCLSCNAAKNDRIMDFRVNYVD